jgi:hypothetical protein
MKRIKFSGPVRCHKSVAKKKNLAVLLDLNRFGATRKDLRKWTGSEKLEVVQDAKLFGVAASSRKHGVSSTMKCRWRSQYEKKDPAGL